MERKRTRPASEYVNPKEFLQTWNYEAFQAVKLRKQSNKDDEDEDQTLEQISELMSVSYSTVQELAEICGKHTLYSGNEPKNPRDLLTMPFPPSRVDLESVRYQVEQRKKRSKDRCYKIACHRQMKYNVMDDYMRVMPDSINTPAIEEKYQVQLPNVVLTVQVTKCFQHGEIPRKFREMETFLVLGTQTLSALRDEIKCASDSLIGGDYSVYPNVDPETLECSGDLYKSSFFFIENVFYNDTRLPDNKDYSKVIRKWAEEEVPDTEYKTEEMSKVKFNDLNIRLGIHYLFLHQGNCEHSVLFTDIRLHNSEDAQDIRHFPLLFCTRLKNRSVCQACQKFSARWIVKGSELTPTDPGFLCKTCFKCLLYDENGTKKSDFKAYHYTEYYKKKNKDALEEAEDVG